MRLDAGTKESIRRWNGFADVYSKSHGEKGDRHKEVFLNPTIFSLTGNIENKNVLDAGCGEGYLSRMLSGNGAEVTAVDYSTRMLEIAKERTSKNVSIKYMHGNCEDLHILENNSFDLIISNMVIQDLANYQQAFQEMHRVLKDGGVYIFSILHPCFITPASGWERSENGEKLHWNVDHYFYEGVYEQPFGDEEKMLLFHRTLTSYVSALMKTGFVIENMVEPKPSDEMIEKYPSFKEDLRSPNFLVFKLRK